MVSEIWQLRSDIVTCRLCFSVDLDVATFIFPSALDIDGGYAVTQSYNLANIHLYTPITLYPTAPLYIIIIIFDTVLRQKRICKRER